MKLIQELSDKISEEIHDAKSYIEMSLQYRDDYPELARTLYTISTEEMEHMNKLHNAVVEIVNNYRKTNGQPPADMLAVYEYLHKRQIERSLEVKLLQTMYKEG